MNNSRLVLVTGGAGRVGNAVVRELLRQDFGVRVTVRSGQRPVSLVGVDPLDIVKADVLQPETLPAALKGVTDVLHLASLISLKPGDALRMEEINVRGTERLLHAALQAGVQRLTHMSSCEAYECVSPRAAVNESTPLNISSPRGYARSKALATQLSLGFHSDRMKISVVAPTGVIGPLDFEPSMQAREFLRSLKGRVAVVPDAYMDVIDVRDLAKATIRSLDAGKGGESYLLAGHDTKTAEFIRLLRQEALGQAGRVLGVNPRHIQRGLMLQDRVSALFGRGESGLVEGMSILSLEPRFDSSKARRELGLSPRPLEETARDTATWLKEKRWQQPAYLEGARPN